VFSFGGSSDDPDLLTAGCFLLQHDPSANNRKLAAEQIHVTLQTAQYFCYRIRDVKPTVRCAALAALEHASILRGDHLVLDSAQLAEIVLAGITDRYESHKTPNQPKMYKIVSNMFLIMQLRRNESGSFARHL
jgi:hypothetical protein